MHRNTGLMVATLALVASGTCTALAAPAGYVVALATPLPAPKRQIVDGVLWKCTGDRCAAPADGSQPIRMCQRVTKAFGTVTRFVAPSGELSSEELSRCNGED